MLKVGIIGSGFGLYGLLPAFSDINDCHVVSICGKKTDRLLKYCKSINLDNVYTDWKDMLKNEDLDALAIAVRPRTQYEIARVAIKKKINIFAEKPLALNQEQTKELLDLAEKNGIVHAVDFIFPEIKAWQEVKKMLDQDTYGKLKHVSVNWDFLSYDIKNGISSWKTDINEGGGALSFYFSHSLYYLEYYAGEILDVKSSFSYSDGSANGGESGLDIIIKFKNGVDGSAHINASNAGLNRHQLIFECEKGKIILENKNSVTENFTINIYTKEESKRILVEDKKVKIDNEEDERVDTVRKIATRFVVGCNNKEQILPSFVEGHKVQVLIDKIRKDKA